MNNIERRNKNLAYISDHEVMDEQRKCRKILQKLNFADRSDFEAISEIVKELLGDVDAFINPPFYCDYGKNISVGKNLFINLFPSNSPILFDKSTNSFLLNGTVTLI